MSTGRIQFAEQDGTFVLKFVGEVRLTLCSALDATIERIFSALNFNAIVIDLKVGLTILIEININEAIDAKRLNRVVADNDCLGFRAYHGAYRACRCDICGQPTIEGKARRRL